MPYERERNCCRPKGRCCMRKGRPPHVTLRRAEAIARKRGDVIPVPGGRCDAFDLIICEEFRTVFVRVRCTLSRFTWPLEVLQQYRHDIARVCRLPLTAVVAREFWLRMPDGRWQFFLVRCDGITEIGPDGKYWPKAELPVEAGVRPEEREGE
ncbi:MAG: hypothetical protein CVV32_04130 [Methanomicrobiales archaeon HGW-Methanomicrobiales-3]|jgi:hypothetical protein|nr:MAG: hypothetical protein CVV32_04130 [Methanomicrobiales archaeon HGW-Methanomicrobiales-3]